nr:glycosyl hydrolase family 28-related protein [Neobacillus drentensis]
MNDYASYKSGTNWSPAITKAITDVANAGGGTIYFPTGIYTLSGGIEMVNNVRLKGAGVGQTTLQMLKGSNKNMFRFHGVSFTGITDMFLDGNKWNGNNTLGSGIVIDGTGFSNTDSGAVVHGLVIERLWIKNFAENGFSSLYPVWQYTIRQVDIEFCDGHGMYITSTDNAYESIIVGNCKGNGIYDKGANNRYVSLKSIFNGNGSMDYLNTAGFYLENASRQTFVNVEAQENYAHGFIIKNTKNLNFSGVVTDANGYKNLAVAGTPVAGDGMQIIGSTNITIRSFQATNFKPQKTQDRPLYIDGTSSNIFIDYQTDNNCARDLQISSDLNINIQRNMDALMNRFKYGNETLNNFILNGQWTGGLTSWNMVAITTPTISNGVATFTASANYSRFSQTVTLANGRNYFISAKVQTTSTSVSLGVLKNSSPYPVYGKVSATARGSGTWETLSNFFRMTDTTGSYELQINDGRSSGWDAISVKEFIIIDITNVFVNTSFPIATNSALALNDIIDANGGWFQGIKNFGLSFVISGISNAEPTTGTYKVAQQVINATPVAGGFLGWVCITAGTANNNSWANGKTYAVDTLVSSGTNVYKCTKGGTSGPNAPTGTGTSISDGGCTWRYVSAKAVFKPFGAIGM